MASDPRRNRRALTQGGLEKQMVNTMPGKGNDMTIEEFRRRLAAEGLKPDEAALKEMYDALPMLQAMRARVHGDYDMAEEPASTFNARLGL